VGKDSERKTMSESERERKRNLHPLVTMDTDSLSREVSNNVPNFLTNFRELTFLLFYLNYFG
jgi:hypothetical protein